METHTFQEAVFMKSLPYSRYAKDPLYIITKNKLKKSAQDPFYMEVPVCPEALAEKNPHKSPVIWRYRVAKTHRMPEVAGHFSQKSH